MGQPVSTFLIKTHIHQRHACLADIEHEITNYHLTQIYPSHTYPICTIFLMKQSQKPGQSLASFRLDINGHSNLLLRSLVVLVDGVGDLLAREEGLDGSLVSSYQLIVT